MKQDYIGATDSAPCEQPTVAQPDTIRETLFAGIASRRSETLSTIAKIVLGENALNGGINHAELINAVQRLVDNTKIVTNDLWSAPRTTDSDLALAAMALGSQGGLIHEKINELADVYEIDRRVIYDGGLLTEITRMATRSQDELSQLRSQELPDGLQTAIAELADVIGVGSLTNPSEPPLKSIKRFIPYCKGLQCAVERGREEKKERELVESHLAQILRRVIAKTKD